MVHQPSWYFQFPSLRRFAATLLVLAAFVVNVLPADEQNRSRVVHVFVALADNAHQGIVPVPAVLGNGDDPGRNLYWGAAYGVRTFFKKSAEWKELAHLQNPTPAILERAVFYCASSGVYLIADAYRGSEIKQAIGDFFEAAAGQRKVELLRVVGSGGKPAEIRDAPSLVVYVGHDGLMDFAMEKTFTGATGGKRQAMVLACASKSYFGPSLRATGAQPLLWTTGLMAPEAYALKAAMDGWMAGESSEEIRQRAAGAYAKYQRISEKAAMRLFVNGW
jgi:hypothetical protein